MTTVEYKCDKEDTIHKEHEKITGKLQGSFCISTGNLTTKPRHELHKAVDTMKQEVKE
jgi:hypothetical protein